MRRVCTVTIAVMALVAAACGGGSGDELLTGDDATTSSAPTTAPTSSTEPFDISMVERSVVKILAEGTFVDPQVGLQFNSAGSGTGFIISDDGVAVTNNHVVTGAALLRVWVAGENEPVNARILGVSECSDLAVIQLAGDGYTPLAFREEPATTGLDVFAAGFPGSDADTIEEIDYTLTSGIVSSLTADGETNWASVDDVIEHDARIRGGNSGGPLVDELGRVVAVNYAGIESSDQNYAITAADARPVIDELTAGADVDSIGINGQAIIDDALGVSGIWVASVDSGSPADRAGVEPGDIVTRLEGLILATDGTMSDYCDVIRTKGADATMAIEVLRYDTDEVLEGQLNGDPLEPSFSFAQEFDEEVLDNTTGSAVDTYTDYTTVSDDSGLITVSVPVAWTQVDGTENPNFGPSIWASPDIEAFIGTWDVPGIIVESSPTRTSADIDATLSEIDFSGDCLYDGRQDYEDPLYVGQLDVWSECGPTSAVYLALAATPPDGSYLIRVLIQAVEPRDLDAADEALATFVANI